MRAFAGRDVHDVERSAGLDGVDVLVPAQGVLHEPVDLELRRPLDGLDRRHRRRVLTACECCTRHDHCRRETRGRPNEHVRWTHSIPFWPTPAILGNRRTEAPARPFHIGLPATVQAAAPRLRPYAARAWRD